MESGEIVAMETMDGDDKDRKERKGWQGTMDFIMTCIGYAVGLGNIWRFPYLCYKSGGGAFFIPYVIFLTLCGIPLFLLEAVYGQFSSLSPITIWKMSPLFQGVGFGMVIVSAIVCVYYNVIVAYTIYYLFMSLRAVLPWSQCGNWWNTDNCLGVEKSLLLASNNGSTDSNISMMVHASGAGYSAMFSNDSRNTGFVSSSEEFWERFVLQLINGIEETEAPRWQLVITLALTWILVFLRHVLQLSSGIEEPDALRWQLVITLALAWILVFFCLFQGVAVLGKIMHFCAPFPYLVLLVLLVRGVTLEGASEGIKFYIIPRWEKLATFQVWGDAALQIFYSVGMGWGGVVTMASYNNFKHNIYRDAMIVPVINCCTSVFAGFVIFSILGFMAHQTGKSVEDVVKQGPGLTFVAYPEAVSMLPVSPLWAVLFFLMLLVVGIDSQFGMVETCLSAFLDEFPDALRDKRILVAAIGCFIEFLLGLPLVTKGGIYVLQIIDWYCASFSLMVISFSECVAISWVYGIDRFYKDIELMIGYQPSPIWSYLWRFVTPVLITFIWLFSIVTLGPVTYGEVTYPGWAVTFGWCLGAISLIPLILCPIYKISRAQGTILQRIKKLSRPAADFGPREPVYLEEYRMSLGKTRTTDLEEKQTFLLDGKNSVDFHVEDTFETNGGSLVINRNRQPVDVIDT